MEPQEQRMQRKHVHARSHLRRKLAQQREHRQPQLVERSPEREARSGTVSKTFQAVQRVAYYVGTFAVPVKDDQAHDFVQGKLSQLKINAKSLSGKPTKLFILPTGIKVYQVDGETLFMAHALPRITFVVPMPQRQLFAFVAINPPSKGGEPFCHCFHCSQSEYATELSTLVTKAFKLAYAARMSNEKKFDETRGPASVPTPTPSKEAPERRVPPPKPGRTGNPVQKSQSCVEGPRPGVKRRSLGTDPPPPPVTPPADSIEEQQRAIGEERRRLMDRKQEIAQKKATATLPAKSSNGGGPGSGYHAGPGTLSRSGEKGPPPALPERYAADPLPVGMAAAGGPTSAAAASRQALANRSSFHGGASGAGMMKRRVAKSKSDTGTGKPPPPACPPRETDSRLAAGANQTLPVRGRAAVPPPLHPPPRDTDSLVAGRRAPPPGGRKPRPVSVAVMSGAAAAQSSPSPEFLRPTAAARKTSSSSSSPTPAARQLSSAPQPSFLVDGDYDIVESKDRKLEPGMDDDYDLVEFCAPPPPVEPPEPINEQPKPKPRKSIRQKKPEAKKAVSFEGNEGASLYDDVPEEEMMLQKSDPKLPRRGASMRYDMRVRSNSIDYEEMVQMKPPQLPPAETGANAPELPPPLPSIDDNSSDQGDMEDYEFMAKQPSPPASRHASVTSNGSGPATSPSLSSHMDEEEDIECQLQELQLEEQALQEAEWFQAAIPREMAMDILRQQPKGGFVVRHSRTNPGSYSLTVKAPNSKLISFLIKRNPDTNLLSLSDNTTQTFPDLPSLVEFYSVNPSLLPCLLCVATSNPAAKQDAAGMIFDDKDYEQTDFSNMTPWPGNR